MAVAIFLTVPEPALERTDCFSERFWGQLQSKSNICRMLKHCLPERIPHILPVLFRRLPDPPVVKLAAD